MLSEGAIRPRIARGRFRLNRLECRLAHIARAIFEAREFLQERELNLADGPIALLGDDQLRFASLLRTRVFVLFVNFRPNE